MSTPISRAADLTRERITEMLARNGHLPHGRVSELKTTTFQSYFADFYQLRIKYSPDVSPALPMRMVLKVPFAHNQAALDMGRDEIYAYRTLHELMPEPPLVRWFDAFVDELSGESYLLLEDLSETHRRGESPDDISEDNWKLCVESLADLHAFFWESTELGQSIGHIPDEADLAIFERSNREHLPKFFDALGAEASPALRATYDAVARWLVDFWTQRLTSRSRNTLIHGDAHSWNFLFPRSPEYGQVFMIDLATLRVRPATNDLAYLMALKWRPDRRSRYEQILLSHYHNALLERGVKNYSREDCFADYRSSILTHLFTPVTQCGIGYLSDSIWRANFERIYSAFHDLNCKELL